MRTKRAVALVVILIAVAAASSLLYRRANRLRADTSPGIGYSATTDAPIGAGGLGRSAFTEGAPKPRSASPAASKEDTGAAIPEVNPYAVVRGGICVPSSATGQEEASRKKWQDLLRDPYWQSVYSGVDPDRFHLVKTSLPLDRYVNYWKMENGQVIHWTGKRISIPTGTRVFTDGQGAMYLCACGNQVAAILPPGKQKTVLPAGDEPPTAYLVPPEVESGSESLGELSEETPALLASSGMASAPPFDESQSMPPGPSTPPIFIGGPSTQGGAPGSPIGPGQPGGPPGNSPGNPAGNPSGNPPGDPGDPPVVPEPGTLSLILLGLGASAVARRRRTRQ
jgi:hypothetical protein